MIIVNVSHYCEPGGCWGVFECREYPVYPDQTSGVLAGAGWAGLRHAMKMAAAALPSTRRYAPPLLRNWLRSKTSAAAELVSCSPLHYAKLETIRNNEQEYR